MNYTIKTDVDGSRITQEICSEFGSLRDVLVRQVIDAADQQVQGALVKLGWTPPTSKTEAAADWRKLAHQFDAQRMNAMAHLRCLLAHPRTHADAARAFLAMSATGQIAAQPAKVESLRPKLGGELQAIIHAKHFDPRYVLTQSDRNSLEWYRLGFRDAEEAHGITR